MLAEVEAAYGPSTVYAVGLQIIEHSQWPPHLSTLPAALALLDGACRANVRGADVGYYGLQPLGARELRVACRTPTPVAFECGGC